jgi:hypothetical protein
VPSSAAPSAPAASLTPQAGPTPSVSASGGGPASCTTRDLRVKVVNTQGAAGSVYQNIDFRNIGPAPCSLYGYPQVALGIGRPFQQVGAAALRSTITAPTRVKLSPGSTGNALLRVVQALNFPPAACSPTATTYLQVYPPDQTTAVYLRFKAIGCASSSVNLLTIGVVQMGTGGK